MWFVTRPGLNEITGACLICIPAERAERIRHGVAALQQGVQPVRLLFQELNGLHLHPQHHPHLTLQAGELDCMGGRVKQGEDGSEVKVDRWMRKTEWHCQRGR